MTDGEAFSIAIPALALVVVLLPESRRWGRRPWLVKEIPRRGLLAVFVSLLLLAAVLHAASNVRSPARVIPKTRLRCQVAIGVPACRRGGMAQMLGVAAGSVRKCIRRTGATVPSLGDDG
jgi:hypothetical protein